ncbi:hypothetical protein D3C86_1586900 [compost metagenome]
MKIAASSPMWIRPMPAIIRNHSNITGPNSLPIDLVPNCCIKKTTARIAITIEIVVLCDCFSPSIAEVMVMGGVIRPSASNAAPPIIPMSTIHLEWRRTSAYREKIPPSPLLSARKVSHTYLIVV